MRAIPVNPARLAEQLEPSAVDIESLKANYGPMLKLVKELIGVVPNADAFLAIWPTGFRTYNLLVPNLLNLPVSLWGGGAPKALVGLAMYAASRTAGCAYCSAHTCSFALRRGASPSTLMGAHPNPREAAVVTIAEALARVPCDLSADQVHTFVECFSADHREWILLGLGLMGFLNKAMDALGVPLEAESIAVAAPFLKFKESLPNATMPSGTQQTAPQPPVDSIGTFFRVLQQAPAAIRLERQ